MALVTPSGFLTGRPTRLGVGYTMHCTISSPSVTIPLTQGKFATIDAQDAFSVLRFKWCVQRTASGRWYAVTYTKGGAKVRKRIHLHRLIMDAPIGVEVDHANNDGLDCRRCNMRLATRQQNVANRAKAKYLRPITSQYKGVCQERKTGKWLASIGFNYRMIYCGTHQSEEDAARAYDEAARRLFGEFANLNFPEEVS